MRRVSKIVAAAEPGGDVEAVRQLGQEALNSGADAIVLVGSLTPKGADARDYGQMLKTLAAAQLPAFYIPGPDDAPFSEFLREAANFEVVFPHLRGVHGTFAIAPGYVVVAGMGGTISDAPETERDEVTTLSYTAWEVEYRLKSLLELKDYQKVFLFSTPPEHKGRGEKGSTVLAELIKKHNPRFVVVPGDQPKQELLGKSLVVSPGSLAAGNFALLDLRRQQVTLGAVDQLAKAS